MLPYEKLALLGIDRDKADRLPSDFKDRLVAGEVTPLMQVSIANKSGELITLPLKLQMVTDRDNNPVLVAYPVKATIDLEKSNSLMLSEHDKERLANGDVLTKSLKVDGTKKLHYLQLDPETNSIIKKRASDLKLEEKLRDMEKVNDIELGTQQKQQVREGKAMELNVGGEKVTVGIDLKEPQGFKVIKGDMKEWDRQQKIKYDTAHPEFIGLVMTDRNRWEYQQVVNEQSRQRAIKLAPDKEERKTGLKL